MKQINVRLQDSEYGQLVRYAAQWGITPTEYARFQMLSPSANWRMRHARVPEKTARDFLDCPDGDLDRLPNGWFKLRGEAQWFWIEGHSE